MRAWVAAGVLVVAVVTGVTTLRSLVAPGSWLLLAAGTVTAVAVTTATARTLGRTRWAPTLWGALVAFALIAALWSAPSGPTLPLPTLGTLRGLRRTAEAGVDAIVHSHIPVAPSPGVTMLVVTGAVAVLLVADLLALGLRRAGAAGLALVTLWVTAVVFERSLPTPALVLGGTTFLLLLALVRPRRPSVARDSSGRRIVATTAVAAAVTVAAIATAPLLAAVPGWGGVRLPTTWGGTAAGGPVELSLDLDMRANLGTQSSRTLLTYTHDRPITGPLRMYTLTSFDGRQWQRDGGPTGPEQDVDGVLWPTTVAAADPGDVTTVRVRVGDLDGDRLPVPLDPRSITLPPGGGWRYDPARDEVLSRSTSIRGLVYELEVLDRDLSSATLQADTAAVVDPGSPLLHLPDTASNAEVRALAEEITADATTPHEQAVALQTWFRDTSSFTYDTRVPAARSGDAVWDFLTDRRGYCVQYATAMTVMARHLGIPARMAVGFLPGRATGSGERVVDGRLAHTWPELWFDESGWVRFEPTPAVQTGAPPVYADPLALDPVSPEEQTTAPPTVAPTSPPAPPPQIAPNAPGGEVALGGVQVPRLLVVAVAAALVLAVLLVRWRRPQRLPHDAEAAWARLRRSLGRSGVTWTDATTPRSIEAVLLARLGPEVPVDVRDALGALVAALEAERYAPTAPEPHPEQLDRWVGTVVDGVAGLANEPTRPGDPKAPVGV